MELFNLSEVDDLNQLVISNATTEDKAESSMKIMQNFNQCMIGMVNFSGITPWEWHPDDEYIQLIKGRVDIKLQQGQKFETIPMAPGDCFVVPKRTWHRQISEEGAKLLFITSSRGNKNADELQA